MAEWPGRTPEEIYMPPRPDADDVVAGSERFSDDELAAAHERLQADADALAHEGIRLMSFGRQDGRLAIEYCAPERERAEDILLDRYGGFATLAYQGASRWALRPQPFGSWLAEENRLHVFYGLGLNGERPGPCVAAECSDGVVVALSVLDWIGAKRLLGGFTPSHATVELAAPVGDRPVIDNAANRARPHWRHVTASR
jgi:hypothetical protein